MRVLVATGAFDNLTSAQTGAAMARAWADLGAQCAVVPIAEAGKGFGQAWADLTAAEPTPWEVDGALVGPAGVAVRVDIDGNLESQDPGSSACVGATVRAVLSRAREEARPLPELWLEVPAFTWADGGAGFWQTLGDERARLSGLRVHLVVTAAQTEQQLTGLRGLTAATMHASGAHPGELLAADQALVDWCTQLGDPTLGTTPGAGAVGGLGAAVLALGGDVVTGPAECARLAGLADTMAQCDLVVTGYDELDFGSKGGDLLPLVAELAEAAMRPAIALARRNYISSRETRTMGIEQGYALAPAGGSLDEAEIAEAVRPVARTWNW
ncbi:glycerate kinase [Luteococcus sp. H138]|uniref:glycerate kinase n=1 Tax=unclassified Luteococcus TaxID=2639923 RepID=UPI00313AE0F8